MLDAVGGTETAVGTVARWSGRALDPEVTAVFQDAPAELLRIYAPDDLWAAVVDKVASAPIPFEELVTPAGAHSGSAARASP